MKNKWASKAWKGAVLVIRSVKESNEKRSRAFSYLKGKFQNFLGNYMKRYRRLLEEECDHVESFIDWHFLKCVHMFDLKRDYFYSYVREAMNNAIKDIFKKRAARVRAGFAPTYLEGLTEEEIELLVSREVVEESLMWEVWDNLTDRQQNVLDLKLKKVPEYQIRRQLYLSYRELKNILESIKKAIKESTEVKHGGSRLQEVR